VYAEGRDIVKRHPDGRVEVMVKDTIPEPVDVEALLKVLRSR
jgi:hypothetical protein